jgi:hypothetical protein
LPALILNQKIAGLIERSAEVNALCFLPSQFRLRLFQASAENKTHIHSISALFCRLCKEFLRLRISFILSCHQRYMNDLLIGYPLCFHLSPPSGQAFWP